MLQTRRANFYLAALLVAFNLAQIETLILKKTIKQVEQKEAAEVSNRRRKGFIVFGEGLKNASLDGDADYQADASELFTSKQSTFNQMTPSVDCMDKHMTFTASGQPVNNFALNQYPRLTMPYGPSSCGFAMRRNPLKLLVNAPYDDCNVVQQDGYYNLPISWNGIRVILVCPNPDMATIVPPTLPPYLTFFPPQEPTTASPQEPEIPPHLLQLILFYWYLFLYQSQLTPTAPPQEPVPQDLWAQFLLKLFQTTTPPQNPVSQSPSNDMFLFLMQLLKHYPYSPSPQDPISPPPSNYFNPYILYLLHKHKMPPSQPHYHLPQFPVHFQLPTPQEPTAQSPFNLQEIFKQLAAQAPKPVQTQSLQIPVAG